MFIRMRMRAHKALLEYILGEHPPLDGKTFKRVLDVIWLAIEDEGFANLFDFECAQEFEDGTAEEYDDLVRLLAKPPRRIVNLIGKYKSIAERRKGRE